MRYDSNRLTSSRRLVRRLLFSLPRPLPRAGQLLFAAAGPAGKAARQSSQKRQPKGGPANAGPPFVGSCGVGFAPRNLSCCTRPGSCSASSSYPGTSPRCRIPPASPAPAWPWRGRPSTRRCRRGGGDRSHRAASCRRPSQRHGSHPIRCSRGRCPGCRLKRPGLLSSFFRAATWPRARSTTWI